MSQNSLRLSWTREEVDEKRQAAGRGLDLTPLLGEILGDRLPVDVLETDERAALGLEGIEGELEVGTGEVPGVLGRRRGRGCGCGER